MVVVRLLTEEVFATLFTAGAVAAMPLTVLVIVLTEDAKVFEVAPASTLETVRLLTAPVAALIVSMLSVAAPVVVAVRLTVLLAVKAPLTVVAPVSVLLPASV